MDAKSWSANMWQSETGSTCMDTFFPFESAFIKIQIKTGHFSDTQTFQIRLRFCHIWGEVSAVF